MYKSNFNAMKKIINSVLFIFLTVGIVSAKSKLIIKSGDHSLIKVVVNGQHSSWSSVHHFQNLTAGHCQVKVFKQSYDPYTCSNQTYLAHQGRVHVPFRSKVIARFRNNRVKVVSVSPIYRNPQPRTYPGRCANPNYGYNKGYGNNYGRPYYNNNSYRNNTYFNSNNQDFNNQKNDYGLSQNQFNDVLYSIQQSRFNKDKVNVAKQAIANNGVNTNQLLQILNQIDFESSKLEIAKYAYHHTFDKENYFKVNQAFTFSSSKRKLDQYINSVRV